MLDYINMPQKWQELFQEMAFDPVLEYDILLFFNTIEWDKYDYAIWITRKAYVWFRLFQRLLKTSRIEILNDIAVPYHRDKLKDKRVLIIDDIINNGRALRQVYSYVQKECHPALLSVKVFLKCESGNDPIRNPENNNDSFYTNLDTTYKVDTGFWQAVSKQMVTSISMKNEPYVAFTPIFDITDECFSTIQNSNQCNCLLFRNAVQTRTDQETYFISHKFSPIDNACIRIYKNSDSIKLVPFTFFTTALEMKEVPLKKLIKSVFGESDGGDIAAILGCEKGENSYKPDIIFVSHMKFINFITSLLFGLFILDVCEIERSMLSLVGDIVQHSFSHQLLPYIQKLIQCISTDSIVSYFANYSYVFQSNSNGRTTFIIDSQLDEDLQRAVQQNLCTRNEKPSLLDYCERMANYFSMHKTHDELNAATVPTQKSIALARVIDVFETHFKDRYSNEYMLSSIVSCLDSGMANYTFEEYNGKMIATLRAGEQSYVNNLPYLEGIRYFFQLRDDLPIKNKNTATRLYLSLLGEILKMTTYPQLNIVPIVRYYKRILDAAPAIREQYLAQIRKSTVSDSTKKSWISMIDLADLVCEYTLVKPEKMRYKSNMNDVKNSCISYAKSHGYSITNLEN